jgi:hypothetical protein
MLFSSTCPVEIKLQKLFQNDAILWLGTPSCSLFYPLDFHIIFFQYDPSDARQTQLRTGRFQSLFFYWHNLCGFHV